METSSTFSFFLLLLTLFSSILSTTHASISQHNILPLPIHLLREKFGFSGHHINGISCVSWRLAVETNNIRNWKTIPLECKDYVGHYMLGNLYRKDSRFVIQEAITYVQTLNLTKDGKDIWVFDIDETTLSDLPYFAKHGFGSEIFNSTAFNTWVDLGEAVVLPESFKLYKRLLALGIKPVFLTGRPEKQREITVTNLMAAGYRNWDKLILRGESDVKKHAIEYKSEQRKKLEDGGYRIVGNIGDQWSDILGTNIGGRTFKLPDPLYYIG